MHRTVYSNQLTTDQSDHNQSISQSINQSSIKFSFIDKQLLLSSTQ